MPQKPVEHVPWLPRQPVQQSLPTFNTVLGGGEATGDGGGGEGEGGGGEGGGGTGGGGDGGGLGGGGLGGGGTGGGGDGAGAYQSCIGQPRSKQVLHTAHSAARSG